jgi:hypothetical protein
MLVDSLPNSLAYLKLMTEIQSDDLIAALQNIIRTFQKEIIEIAPVIFCTLVRPNINDYF